MKMQTPWTYALIAIFLAVFGFEMLYQFQHGGWAWRISGENLFILGGNFGQAVAAGQYWRLFTACFLHVDAIHVVMNSFALSLFGPMLELQFGAKRLLLAFVITGLAGSALSAFMHLDEVYLSAGASGGLYGLFGLIFISGKRYRLPKSYQIWLNQNLGLMAVFSFAPGIDLWGHFGGLGAGLLLGLLMKPQHWPLFEENPNVDDWITPEDVPQTPADTPPYPGDPKDQT